MVQLWRCVICGDGYIGDKPPANCPFCGAKQKFIKAFGMADVSFDVKLEIEDKTNVEKALHVELLNASFYYCAASKTKEIEGQKLFQTLAKIEAEHASIWKKILKIAQMPQVTEQCSDKYHDNLENSHSRETRAIEFYRKAAKESKDRRIREIFEALVEVESDHLQLSEERLR
jgi:rubrerythrin